MASQAPKTRWQTLRRYALSGQMDAVRELLQQMVKRYPRDAEAAAELKRLQAGLPLHIAESAAERQAREQAEAHSALTHIAAAATPQRVGSMRRAELQRLHQTLMQHLLTLREQDAPAPAGTNACKKLLEQELTRRHKHRRRALLLSAGVVVLVLAALAATAMLLRQRALHLATELEEAYRRNDWQLSQALLEACDTGINRLLAPEAERPIVDVKNRRQAAFNTQKELVLKLDSFEKRGDISAIRLEERAGFLRGLRSLPSTLAAPLAARWETLCRPEQQKLEEQKRAFLSELADLPSTSALTGSAKEDATMLKHAADLLQTRMLTFRDASVAFDLPPELIAPTAKHHASLVAMLADTELMLRTEQALSSARAYERHAEILRAFRPSAYPPALQAAQTAPLLPKDEESMAAALRSLRHNLPLHMPAEMLRAVLEKGPTFSQAYPASGEQVHLMEDVFTARTLRHPLFEITGPDGQTHYSDAPPSVTNKKTVVFSISELDPRHSITRRSHMEWGPAHAVWIRKLDPTKLMQAVNITREHFFLSANLPQLLGSITAVNDEDCPPLARAYLYHTLLELMRLQRNPEAMGLRFSPTLQADAEEFRKLQKRLPCPLTASCWLQRTAEAEKASSAYAQWFAAHAHRDYAEEMKRELGKIMSERLRYIGYTDASAEPHFTTTPAPGTPLWYYSRSGLVTTPAGQRMVAPATFSPIFSE